LLLLSQKIGDKHEFDNFTSLNNKKFYKNEVLSIKSKHSKKKSKKIRDKEAILRNILKTQVDKTILL
jgi:hypothetical protein